jgi:pilus assembly protein TadC
MSLFYTREETTQEITITYMYRALFYWFFLVTVVSTFIVGNLVQHIFWLYVITSWGVLGLFIVFFLVYYIDLRKPDKEFKQAMDQGKAKISGNKFSFSNPVKVVITK